MKAILFKMTLLCLLSHVVYAQGDTDVAGKTTTQELRLTTGATNGYILQSDASGNATWVNPSSLSSDSDWMVGTGSIYNTTDDIGIGHNNPTELLHVKDGNFYLENGELIFSPLGTVSTKLYQAGSNLRMDALANLQLRTGSPYSITFSNASGEYARFKGGSVEGLGIGTISPTAKLHIVDDESMPLAETVIIDKDYDSTTGTLKALEVNLTRNNAGAIQGLDLYVDSNGDGSGIVNAVDITATSVNTSAQTEGLDVHVIRSGGSGTSPTLGFRVQSQNQTTNGSVYGVLAEVCGPGSGVKYGVYSSPLNACTNGGNYYAGYFNGDVFTTGSYLPSDSKLKTALNQESSVLKRMRSLDIVNYEYKKEDFPFMQLPEGRQTGFTAQNLEEAFPELVKAMIHPGAMPDQVELGLEKERDEMHFQGVNYTGMVPYLVKAVQELAEENDLLKNEKEDLQKQINELREMILSMKE